MKKNQCCQKILSEKRPHHLSFGISPCFYCLQKHYAIRQRCKSRCAQFLSFSFFTCSFCLIFMCMFYSIFHVCSFFILFWMHAIFICAVLFDFLSLLHFCSLCLDFCQWVHCRVVLFACEASSVFASFSLSYILALCLCRVCQKYKHTCDVFVKFDESLYTTHGGGGGPHSGAYWWIPVWLKTPNVTQYQL